MPVEVPERIQATVAKKSMGRGGAFFVTYPTHPPPEPFTTHTVITVSPENWKGSIEPQKGQVIELSDLQQFAKGWRALSARPSAESRKETKQ